MVRLYPQEHIKFDKSFQLADWLRRELLWTSDFPVLKQLHLLFEVDLLVLMSFSMVSM